MPAARAASARSGACAGLAARPVGRARPHVLGQPGRPCSVDRAELPALAFRAARGPSLPARSAEPSCVRWGSRADRARSTGAELPALARRAARGLSPPARARPSRAARAGPAEPPVPGQPSRRAGPAEPPCRGGRAARAGPVEPLVPGQPTIPARSTHPRHSRRGPAHRIFHSTLPGDRH
ncbi:hypothetical protein [Amycolatopsis plumensis]|uniref:hypothetical protein n=1 Tax=Amycolatopsis plumensis TaxID=236508 RepID=UPI003609A924